MYETVANTFFLKTLRNWESDTQRCMHTHRYKH